MRCPTSGSSSGPLSPGFTLRFDPEGTVANVVPGSGAERLGMRPGDRILSVNGRTIQRWNPRTWDQALARRKPLAIRWRRGVDERSDRFEVREPR
jgi:S1-C subfamily serine protease